MSALQALTPTADNAVQPMALAIQLENVCKARADLDKGIALLLPSAEIATLRHMVQAEMIALDTLSAPLGIDFNLIRKGAAL